MIRDRQKKKKSIYDVIVLPDQINETTGYHPTCYKCFCGVREKKEIAVAIFGDETDASSSVTVFNESSNDTNYSVFSSNGKKQS